jgi:hypothetical protein
MMGLLTMSFLGRKNKDDRVQALITLDEFASMAGSEVGYQAKVLLAQARKFGASVVLATQSDSQLPDDVRLEFKNNCNNKVVLLVGSIEDARAGVNALGSAQLTPNDLMGVEKFHGYMRLMSNRAAQPACYVKTLAPVTLAELVQASDNTPRAPRVTPSKDFRLVMDLAKDALDPHDSNSGTAVIARLTGMDEASWQASVAECEAYNRYRSQALLDEPRREPDKLKRAMRISRGLYGLPWYYREAFARRLKRSLGSIAPAPAKSYPGIEIPAPALVAPARPVETPATGTTIQVTSTTTVAVNTTPNGTHVSVVTPPAVEVDTEEMQVDF